MIPSRDVVSRETAATVLGDRIPLADRYAELLRTEGLTRGLLGPREADRLWDRHLLNCLPLGEAIPAGRSVADVGSGAGLPGLVLAIARPDLRISLVEPLLRRATFLHEVVASLGLANVEVVRSRAEDLPAGWTADVVTARAVAPLDRLAGWCLPLVAPGGALLALKGERAEAELAEAEPDLRRLGATSWRVLELGPASGLPPVRVIEVRTRPVRRGT
jgi:16S rRNA (guanine527-N7)-methyltransferase